MPGHCQPPEVEHLIVYYHSAQGWSNGPTPLPLPPTLRARPGGPRWWAKDDSPFGYNADDKGEPLLCRDCALPLPLVAPPFITAQDQERAKADNDQLRQLPGAPAWLGSIIIPWAKANPRDPRAPEALHLVVRATQYGDKDSDTSKAAYDLLRSRFPRSPWTAKTPMWF